MNQIYEAITNKIVKEIENGNFQQCFKSWSSLGLLMVFRIMDTH